MRRVVAGSLVYAALVTSCSTHPAPVGPNAAASASISPTDQKTLFNAEQQIIARCMTARGWTYLPAQWHPSGAPAAQDPRRGDDVALHGREGSKLVARYRDRVSKERSAQITAYRRLVSRALTKVGPRASAGPQGRLRVRHATFPLTRPPHSAAAGRTVGQLGYVVRPLLRGEQAGCARTDTLNRLVESERGELDRAVRSRCDQ